MGSLGYTRIGCTLKTAEASAGKVDLENAYGFWGGLCWGPFVLQGYSSTIFNNHEQLHRWLRPASAPLTSE